MVLEALKHSARTWCHGYDVSKLTRLKSGTLYPILSRLHDEGWLEARWEEAREPGRPPRHLYRLSAVGSKATSRILDSRATRTGPLGVVRQN
jgi:DNA-binding PadR family transcriptional regulator